jgi:flavin-dependent dehydrogenase
MTERFDAIVIGGGPAGSTAALLLAKAGGRVAIVEKATFPRRKVCGEFISTATWPLFDAMGVGDALLPLAGPAVRRVGVFAGDAAVTSNLPGGESLQHGETPGRAVDRRHLDTLLLERAIDAGVRCFQPWSLTAFSDDCAAAECTIEERGTKRTRVLRASVVVAAHGAWETGPLPTQQLDRRARDGDLLGFKAHFRNARLPPDLMPLIAFPGGYGGLVNTGDGLLSMSCCIRRDALDVIRRRWPGDRAGDALRSHIEMACSGVADVLSGARLEGAWLAAGPMRTGIRGFGSGRIVAIGNAAAEAHPIVAEGISMAIQSAHLACAALVAAPGEAPTAQALNEVRRVYEREWRRNFSLRVHAAALFAHLFMRPVTAIAAARLLGFAPAVLTLGAHWSGKDCEFSGLASPLLPEGHR